MIRGILGTLLCAFAAFMVGAVIAAYPWLLLLPAACVVFLLGLLMLPRRR